MVSVGPPAGYGTTIVIGRDGKEFGARGDRAGENRKSKSHDNSHNNSHEPAHVIFQFSCAARRRGD